MVVSHSYGEFALPTGVINSFARLMALITAITSTSECKRTMVCLHSPCIQ